MKRLLATVMTVCLLLGLPVCGVSAEGTFEFQEIERYDDQEDILAIEWNEPADGSVVISGLKIGDITYQTNKEQPGLFSVDTSSLKLGLPYRLTCLFQVNGGAVQSKTLEQPYVKGRKALVSLTLSVNESGNAVVKVTDVEGKPLEGYKLLLSIGDMAGMNGVTGADGVYTSRITANYGETVSCKGHNIQSVINGVLYAVAEEVQAVYQKPTTTTPAPTTTTTVTEETTTTLEGGETTTTVEGDGVTTTTEATTTTKQPTVNANATTASQTKTNQTIRGAGTTSIQNDRVALNISLDENILSAFGLKKSDFANRARLLLTKDDYNNLTGRSSHQLMLNVLTAENEPSAAQINAAIAGVSKYSTYDEEHRKAITFDLSFLKINNTTGEDVPISALPINSTYIVQLPVPADMKDCEMLAVTLFSGDALVEPMEVKVQGGAFSLEINSLESYTLIGFGTEEGGGNSNSVLLIVLLIVGILLLAAAAVLVYLFILRKPEPKKAAPAFVPASFDENDIFSGRDDISEINRRPTDNGNK